MGLFSRQRGAHRRLEDALDAFSLHDERALLLAAALERAKGIVQLRGGTVADIAALRRVSAAANAEAESAAVDVAVAIAEYERLCGGKAETNDE